ncbi:hypothetical protein K438DRAFT_1933793 [Mycena galopus ATCC 62051]|nr:hypothetical protein K438DRAFT_1933793 [Mycena galopus ATCC 62051]
MSQIDGRDFFFPSYLSRSWAARRASATKQPPEPAAEDGRHLTTVSIEYDPEDPRYEEETYWTGGVNHYVSNAEGRWETDSSNVEPDPDTELSLPLNHSSSHDGASNSDSDPELELVPLDLDNAAVVDGIAQEENRQAELWRLSALKMDLSANLWRKAEANRSLGYNGRGRSTQYRNAQKDRGMEVMSSQSKQSPQAMVFAGYFQRPIQPLPSSSLAQPPPAANQPAAAIVPAPSAPTPAPTPAPASALPPPSTRAPVSLSIPPYPSRSLQAINNTSLHAPPWGRVKKRRKLDVLAREQVHLKKEKRQKDFRDALTAIEKMVSLKRTQYQSPLQAKRVRVIQSTLHLFIRNSRKLMDASAMAAETHGSAASWVLQLARRWTAGWVKQ